MFLPSADLPVSPFLNFIGANYLGDENGESRFSLKLLPQHLNLFGSAHGGLIQTLNDAAMAQAARALHQGQKTVLTLQMQTYFLQTEKAIDAELLVCARVLHHSATMAVCEANCFSQQTLLAKSSGQFKFSRLRS